MRSVQLATVLRGAEPFKEGNVNETYRGQVLTEGGETRAGILKDLDVIQLSNELLAFVLAREVGLPVPDCYLGLVRPDVLELEKAPMLADGSRLGFVSIDVKVPNVVYQLQGANRTQSAELLHEIAGWGDLGQLYAYDTWIANVDRHPGNLLFGGSDEVWLIDHGHSFTGPRWRPSELDPSAEYRNRLGEWLTGILTPEIKKSGVRRVRQFSEQVNGFDAGEAADFSKTTKLLPEPSVQALRRFLERRIAEVPAQASKALGVPVLV